ncbi:hypothetical protein [Marinitoga lauensis]|uniref:hypothetical protein n=1 Tax=Marinitoga lauensis TaxID=2201189 RepID=UPI00197D61C2|nr:hypothetical protein [Marinitoga lauensis]
MEFEIKKFIYEQGKEEDVLSTILLKEIIRFFRIKRLLDIKYYGTAKNEINKLKKNLSHLPNYGREIIIPAIEFLSIENYEKILIRKYSKKSYSNVFLELLNLKMLSKEYIKEKDYNKLWNILLRSYEFSFELGHPHLICKTLEDGIKVFKKKDKVKVYYFYKMLQYYVGYYFDDIFRINKWLNFILKINFLMILVSFPLFKH